MTYLDTFATQLGVSVWIISLILIWSVVWKLLALWKSARKGHLVWFIVVGLVNTVGILEILYIFLFSEMKYKPNRKPVAKKKKK